MYIFVMLDYGADNGAPNIEVDDAFVRQIDELGINFQLASKLLWNL